MTLTLSGTVVNAVLMVHPICFHLERAHLELGLTSESNHRETAPDGAVGNAHVDELERRGSG